MSRDSQLEKKRQNKFQVINKNDTQWKLREQSQRNKESVKKRKDQFQPFSKNKGAGFRSITDYVDFQNNYCKIVDDFRKTNPYIIDKKTGFPIKQQQIVLTDYYHSIPGDVFKNYINAYDELNQKVKHILKKQDQRVQLSPEIAFFYANGQSDNYYWRLNQTFACKWQRSTKSLNQCSLSVKSQIKKNVKNYVTQLEERKLSQCFNAKEFSPFYYYLNDKQDCKDFFKQIKQEQSDTSNKINWLLKGDGHRGTKIQVINKDLISELKTTYNNGEYCEQKRKGHIIQKYINNPKLANGHKFDMRVYLQIANRNPLIALYHPGYIRLGITKYDQKSQDL